MYETELSSALELRVRNPARIHDLVITPLEAQWEDEIPNFDVRSSFRPFLCEAQAVLTKVLQAIRKILRETMAVLPTLYHVENSVSTHEPERTAMAYQKIWDEMGIDLSGNFPTATNDQSDTLGRGVSYLMTSLTISITSLKLREVPFENWLYHWRIPDQVVHLDIELRISQEIGTLEDPVQTCFAVQDWRKQFTALKRLKTLRLSLSCEGLYPNEDEWFEMGGPHLYFDNLLTGPELSVDRLEAATCELERRKHKGISEAGVINDCTFPRLESLSLINCPLREEGLLYLAVMHQRTLRSIQLHRVVFDATPGQMPVKELAKLRNYLPNLTHLVLSKIDLYDPDRGHFDLDLEMREEVASVYRWDKGDGGGDDGLVRYAWDLGRIVEGELGPGS